MMNFEEGQTVQPLYDYYIETDLDSVDQPVDYSKKYADQDSDEVCGSGKKRHLSMTSVTLFPSKPEDEVKVYCIEGTPLMISSASSMCDLREIGTPAHTSDNENVKHVGRKPCFQSVMYTNVTEETNDSMSAETVEMEDDKPAKLEEKEASCGEVAESSSFRTEENSSKVSSPLMFSRSSSVGSLNSFEQQSIIDDRSSVSIFSTLTSGIISPSDIPDSPGEAMSPFIHKSNKTEFLFPTDHNEKSMDPIFAILKINAREEFDDNTFDDILEDDVKVFDDEGDFCAMSMFSALTYLTNSTHVSHKVCHSEKRFSSVEHKSTIKVSHSVPSSPKKDLGSCIKEDLKTSVQDCSKSNRNYGSSFSNYSNTEPLEVGQLDEGVRTNDVVSTANIHVEETIQKDMGVCYPDSVDFDEVKHNTSSIDDKNDNEKIIFLLGNESEEYSQEISDDEDDALVEECIKSGMPGSNLSDTKNCKQIESHQIRSPNVSENAASDDENNLMENCIQLHMPQLPPMNKTEDVKTKNARIQAIISYKPAHINISSNKHSTPVKDQIQLSGCPNFLSQSNFTKSQEVDEPIYSDEDDALLDECIKLGMPKTKDTNKNKSISGVHGISNVQPAITNSRKQESSQLQNAVYLESDASEDENDLIAECIQLGKPHSSSSDLIKTKEIARDPQVSDNFGLLDQWKRQQSIHEMDTCDEKHSTDSWQVKSFQGRNEQQNCVYSENDTSEDENDLIAECIQLGRPRSSNSDVITKKERIYWTNESTGPNRNRFSYSPPNKPVKPDLLVAHHQVKSSNSNKPFKNIIKKSYKPSVGTSETLFQRPRSLGMSRNGVRGSTSKIVSKNTSSQHNTELGYRDIPDGTSDRDDDNDDDDDLLSECIRAGMPGGKEQKKKPQLQTSSVSRNLLLKYPTQKKIQDDRILSLKKSAASSPSQGQMCDPDILRTECISPSAIANVDSMCVYRTEDTPILSPTASISDLSTLSFSEDKMCQENYLNNSRNSDWSSESDDDELLMQCIRSGMPGARRAVA